MEEKTEQKETGWDKLSSKDRETEERSDIDPRIATDPILKYFTYTHLPSRLQMISEPFCSLADTIVNTLPRNPERTVALRKLLEAKDAAVRCAIE